MGKESVLKQLCKPQFVELDRDIPTLFGVEARRAGSLAAGAAMLSAFLVIPTVFMAASKDETVKTIGIWLGYSIWTVLVLETLVFIRLEKGWGNKWLKKHWLQLLVILVASPFTAIVLENSIMPLVAVLFSVQNFITLAYLSKVLATFKVVKLLKLVEAFKMIGKVARRMKWLYRTAVTSISFCGLGILGAAASGGAPTPLHGLELWWNLAHQSVGVAPELFLVSVPIVGGIGGFALIQNKFALKRRRR